MSLARATAAVVFTLCITAASACEHESGTRGPIGSPTSASPSHGKSAGPIPIAESAPYWCDLIPKDALTRVTGASAGLHEFRNAEASKNSTICGAKDKERYGPLGVQWNTDGGRKEIVAWKKDVASDHPTPLPARLGSGFTVHSVSASRLPYFTASTFGCGPHDPWIEIFIRDVVPGRDASRDLTDLMRIAQRRFGRLHRCVPKPLSES